MSNECHHDCGACQEECDERSFLAPMNAHSHVKKVIGIVSGKVVLVSLQLHLY